MDRLVVGSVGVVSQVAENRSVRDTLAILDPCSLKVKVKYEMDKTSQIIMTPWEGCAANHGEPQSLASGGRERLLLAKPPDTVCCWVPSSLEDENCNAVQEFQHLQETAQAIFCAGPRGVFRWGGRQDLHPPEDQQMTSPKVHRGVSSENAESDCHENPGRLQV